MNKSKILSIVAAIIIVASVMFIDFSNTRSSGSKTYYSVYVNGEFLGNTSDDKKFLDYLDEEYKRLNKESKIGAVFLPENYQIVENRTESNASFNRDERIFNKFKDGVEFLVSGYKVRIDGIIDEKVIVDEETGLSKIEYVPSNSTKIIYTDSKKSAVNAFNRILHTYVSPEDIAKLESQQTIETLSAGETFVLEYFTKSMITGSTELVPYDEVIEGKDLYNYMLFGDSTEEKKYVVQEGDSFKSIADKHKFSVEELSASNSGLSKDSILVPGQELVVNFPNPIVKINTVSLSVVDQVIPYETVVVTDANKRIGSPEVVQVEGVNGVKNITYKQSYLNGMPTSTAEILEESLIKEPISRVVVVGGQEIPGVGTGIWGRLTNGGITTSGFGYRSLGFHYGTDIAGLPIDSPVFAADNGIVRFASSGSNTLGGNLIIIDHQNGYGTYYLHLNSFNVKVGQTVARGDHIGGIGNTGFSFGAHLHFEVRVGYVYNASGNIWTGTAVDPATVDPIFVP